MVVRDRRNESLLVHVGMDQESENRECDHSSGLLLCWSSIPWDGAVLIQGMCVWCVWGLPFTVNILWIGLHRQSHSPKEF